MTNLSPAAQAVLDAFLGDCANTGLQMDDLRENVAAALRAAADQVVPEDYSSYTGHPEHDFAMEARNDSAREAILAIAAELEAQ
jgi:acetyl esterase/lipase